ncbi:hypothetical protein [Klebsiella aerogenes EA1509E]|nr:hypothetical protein [Klebsiella aerogenes EA1509E]
MNVSNRIVGEMRDNPAQLANSYDGLKTVFILPGVDIKTAIQ